MGSIKKKKTIHLSRVFLKYFIFLCLGVLIIVFGALVGFNMLFSNNLIYPADYAQQQAEHASENIANGEEVNSEMIPELCQYMMFDTKGTLENGNMKERNIEKAWEAVQGKNVDGFGNYFKVIPRRDGYCVLRFQIIPQYQSAVLREYLPSPQNLMLILIMFFIVILTMIIAVGFGRELTKKLNPLIEVTKKIEKQTLDFSMVSSNIKEINTVLEAMDKMRIALKESLEKQWQLEHLRKEQISALAHDLKTPMTIIRGNAELLNDTVLSTEQKECRDYIESSALQMQEYVKTLIEISNTEKTISMFFESVDLLEFIEKLKTQINGLMIAKQIKLLWTVKEVPQKISLNSELFLRVLMNVFSNAVDFTPKNGEIYFTVKSINNLIEFKIWDNGPGFSQTALTEAVTQFYMEDKSRTSHLHYGMGLYITQRIIEQHHGTMELKNSQMTGGAEVTIKLPLVA